MARREEKKIFGEGANEEEGETQRLKENLSLGERVGRLGAGLTLCFLSFRRRRCWGLLQGGRGRGQRLQQRQWSQPDRGQRG